MKTDIAHTENIVTGYVVWKLLWSQKYKMSMAIILLGAQRLDNIFVNIKRHCMVHLLHGSKEILIRDSV